jgi:hypothetical protein
MWSRQLQPLGELDEHKRCLRRILHYMFSPREHPFLVVMRIDAVGTKHRSKPGTEGNMLEGLHQAVANTHS